MSVSAVHSHPSSHRWEPSTSSKSGTSGRARGDFDPALPGGSSPTNAGSGTAAAAASPVANLARDIQALLLQAQSAGSAAGTAATSSTPATAAEQKLATDLQSVMNDLGNGASNPTTASVDPTDATGQVHSHHHHHRHEGGQASGATGEARNNATNGAASTGTDQAVSRIFAVDIKQALQAYGSKGASSTTTSMTG